MVTVSMYSKTKEVNSDLFGKTKDVTGVVKLYKDRPSIMM